MKSLPQKRWLNITSSLLLLTEILLLLVCSKTQAEAGKLSYVQDNQLPLTGTNSQIHSAHYSIDDIIVCFPENSRQQLESPNFTSAREHTTERQPWRASWGHCSDITIRILMDHHVHEVEVWSTQKVFRCICVSKNMSPEAQMWSCFLALELRTFNPWMVLFMLYVNTGVKAGFTSEKGVVIVSIWVLEQFNCSENIINWHNCYTQLISHNHIKLRVYNQ